MWTKIVNNSCEQRVANNNFEQELSTKMLSKRYGQKLWSKDVNISKSVEQKLWIRVLTKSYETSPPSAWVAAMRSLQQLFVTLSLNTLETCFRHLRNCLATSLKHHLRPLNLPWISLKVSRKTTQSSLKHTKNFLVKFLKQHWSFP